MNLTVLLILASIGLILAAFLWFARRSVDGLVTAEIDLEHAFPAKSVSSALTVGCEPDTPKSFGYKMTWFVIPTVDSEKVMRALGLAGAIRANWASGVGAVQRNTLQAFVTPAVEGRTMVLGLGLPSFDTPVRTRDFLAFIDKIAVFFPEFYYFGTHRVVEYHGWVKVSGGKVERAYSYLGERGETLFECGEKSREEIALGFAFFDERSPEAASEGYFDRKDLRFPDEDDVMKISAAWAIDTQKLHQRIDKGTGYLCALPSSP
jgi:hypothetical protein